MATAFVLDASAVLALMNGEPGSDIVAASLPNSAIGAVNLIEVATRLQDAGLPAEIAQRAIDLLDLPVVDLDRPQAFEAARLRASTRKKGLSTGDRACLALAIRENAVALTADRSWEGLEVGCSIRLIR